MPCLSFVLVLGQEIDITPEAINFIYWGDLVHPSSGFTRRLVAKENQYAWVKGVIAKGYNLSEGTKVEQVQHGMSPRKVVLPTMEATHPGDPYRGQISHEDHGDPYRLSGISHDGPMLFLHLFRESSYSLSFLLCLGDMHDFVGGVDALVGLAM
ncbi:hypothetical protein HAX54_001242 [Datura stramonium]|uniref:Uncharacterized protein n=1 Tax=Datura stramonium TaxID=4076 RepID=A0ABS8WQK9_DATST|nr:hypothetical protein [Datura stramonium]